jgi:large subunit GTPase 1
MNNFGLLPPLLDNSPPLFCTPCAPYTHPNHPRTATMVLPKSKNAVGLGNSLMNDRFGKGKGAERKKVSSNQGVVRTNHATGESYVTNAAKEASWVKMRSVTEQDALHEFLSTAELAGTDFTAEKSNNTKIIHADQRNPYLLSQTEERGVKRKHAANRARLTVPRRPKWDEHTTPMELDEMERASLLEWRRGLADLQENDDLLMTPFERNIEVWRQLWRVIERSDLVVQIVDARNPLLFRSADLETYVKTVDSNKQNLLLVNKADMMTEKQRQMWADAFDDMGINFRFFSAHLAKEMNEGKDALETLEEREEEQLLQQQRTDKQLRKNVQDLNLKEAEAEEDDEDGEDDDDEERDSSDSEGSSDSHNDHSSDSKTHILTVDELEALFLSALPQDKTKDKTTIGLVGYPNVGKSSTINALIGAKKVSVSSTPGKTKHFQTIHLSPEVILCDCPGLVFPNFATTKAELVCNGVLPIDQLREFTGPAALVAQRIPRTFLENVYGMKIQIRAAEEGGTGVPTASEMLRAYAKARGFATTGHGQPDESRAARYILKDYVGGKLLYCHPPPALQSEDEEKEVMSGEEFNQDLYDFAHLPAKRQAWLIAHSNSGSNADSLTDDTGSVATEASLKPNETGARSRNLDKRYFAPSSGNAGHAKMPFNYQYSEQGKKQLSGRKLKTAIALEKGLDPNEIKDEKKHFKNRREKQRRARGKPDDDE